MAEKIMMVDGQLARVDEKVEPVIKEKIEQIHEQIFKELGIDEKTLDGTPLKMITREWCGIILEKSVLQTLSQNKEVEKIDHTPETKTITITMKRSIEDIVSEKIGRDVENLPTEAREQKISEMLAELIDDKISTVLGKNINQKIIDEGGKPTEYYRVFQYSTIPGGPIITLTY